MVASTKITTGIALYSTEGSKNMQKKTRYQYLNEASFPTMLQFELTGTCNLKCKQCYNDSGRKTTSMTAEHWKEFSNKVAETLFSVTLSGGEPLLLGEQLFSIMDIFASSNTWINLISNGFFIDRETARRLAKYDLGWVEISIDSPYEDYHDYLRGVQGSWRKAVLAASYLASYNVPVFIGTCVTPKTLSDLEAMVKLTEEIGASGLTLTKIFVSGRAYSYAEELILSEEDTKKFEIEAMKLKKNTKDIVINFTTQSIQDAVQDDTGTTNYQIPIIRPDAKMRLSCFEPIIIGDILDEDIQILWERYKKIRVLLKNNPEKLKTMGRNYVDEEISYVEIL